MTAPVSSMWDFGFSTNFGYEYCQQRPDGRIVLGGMRWLSETSEIGIVDDTVINLTVSNWTVRSF